MGGKTKKTKKKLKHPSELRQDIVTGDWVVIATGRAKRPDDFAAEEVDRMDTSIEECPFEHPEQTGQEKDVLIYRASNGDWSLRVIPNKYPAVLRGRIPKPLDEGPYFGMTGTGYHEIVITRDHSKHLALMEPERVAEVIDAFQDRYLDLMHKKNIRYVSVFHNYGKRAGASVTHPHSQILALPVVSPYIKQELDGAERYKRANKKCAYCEMLEYELKDRRRLVFENGEFAAFAPYASRAAFEVWVLPKRHEPYFERILDEKKLALGETLQKVLASLYIGLSNPDYNFYLHTSPCDGKDYPSFHWHIEILPRTAVWAGFEMSTGIEISTIQPEVAAEFLREHVIDL